MTPWHEVPDLTWQFITCCQGRHEARHLLGRRFRPDRAGQRSGGACPPRGRADQCQPDGRRAGGGRRGAPGAGAPVAARRAAPGGDRGARRIAPGGDPGPRRYPRAIPLRPASPGHPLFLPPACAPPTCRRNPRAVCRLRRHRADAGPRQRAQAHAPAPNSRADADPDWTRIRPAGDPASRPNRPRYWRLAARGSALGDRARSITWTGLLRRQAATRPDWRPTTTASAWPGAAT